jgi:membrane protein DedA with SNARE-associated domain
MTILVTVGYFIGDNKELLHKLMPYITGGVVSLVVLGVVFYMWRKKKKKADADE